METIKINGDNVKIGDAIEIWQEAGVCKYCIDYRLKLNEEFQDSYNNFAFLHSKDCMCD